MGSRLSVGVTIILVLSLLVTTYRYHGSLLRVQNKALASTGFVLIGLFAVAQRGLVSGWQYGGLVLVALMLSLIGDVLLGYGDNHPVGPSNRQFVWGCLVFGLAHVMYVVAFGVRVGWSIGDLVLPGVLALGIYGLTRLPWFDFKGCKWLVIGYTVVLGLMLQKVIDFGLSELISAYAYRIILAALLFVISDGLLVFKYFYKKSHIGFSLVNLVCYYTAQIVFAVGILYL